MTRLNDLYFSLRQLRSELSDFEDITHAGDPNDAMRIAVDIDVALGMSTYFLPCDDAAKLNALIDEALDYLNHAHEVRHGYRSA